MVLGLVVAFTSFTAIAAGSTIVQFWTHEVSEEQLEIQNELAARFMVQFPDIEVEVIPMDTGNYLQKLLTAAGAGQLPDVVYHPMDFAFVLAKQYQEVFDTEAAAEVMNELGINPGEAQIPIIPADGWKFLLLYRKDLFDAYGLDIPDTWDKIRQAAGALHNPPELWGIEVGTDPDQAYMAQIFNWFALSNGALPLDENSEINLDTPEFVEALGVYKELTSFNPSEYVGWQRARSDYLEGRAAMIIWPSLILDELAGLRDDTPVADPELYGNTGFVSGIVGPNGAAEYSYVNCFGITIDADTEAAKEWVRYLLSEGYLQWLSMVPEGKLPLWKGTAADHDAFLDEWMGLEFGVDRREPISEFYSSEAVNTILSGVEGFAFDRWPFEAWGLSGDGMDVINPNLVRFLDGEIVAAAAAQLMTTWLNEAAGTVGMPPRLAESLEDCVNRVYRDCVDYGGWSWFCKIMAASHCALTHI